MAKKIEETLRACKKCKKKTKHMRNGDSTGWLMIVIHLILIVVTFGVWLLLIIIWKILNTKIGGWVCSECRK